MPDIITSGANTITPTVILGYSSTREARTNVHTILGRSNPDITVRPANLRTGSLSLGFSGLTSEGDSRDAETVLSGASQFALESSDRVSVRMAFVASGSIRRELEDSSRDAWLVSFDFQEVTL